MVYLMLVDGFEDIEALEVSDILRRCQIEVKTVGVFDGEATSSHGVTVKADITMKEVEKDKMTMLILPGGPGHTLYEKSQELIDLITYARENDLYISAICAAPAVIGKMGLLNGKKFTCYPGFEKYCEGGIFSEEKAVRDGLVITGKGPGAAAEFGFMIAGILAGEQVAENIRKEMQY